jgi:hypothetical protein
VLVPAFGFMVLVPAADAMVRCKNGRAPILIHSGRDKARLRQRKGGAAGVGGAV